MTTADAIFVLALVVLCLGMTTMAYVFRKGALGFGAAFCWLILGIYAYTLSSTPSTDTWDIYFGLFWMSMGLMLVSALEVMVMKEKTIEEEMGEKETSLDRHIKKVERFQERRDKMNRALGSGGGRRSRRREREEDTWGHG